MISKKHFLKPWVSIFPGPVLLEGFLGNGGTPPSGWPRPGARPWPSGPSPWAHGPWALGPWPMGHGPMDLLFGPMGPLYGGVRPYYSLLFPGVPARSHATPDQRTCLQYATQRVNTPNTKHPIQIKPLRMFGKGTYTLQAIPLAQTPQNKGPRAGAK